MVRVIANAAIVVLALSGCGQAPDPSPTVKGKADLEQIARDARRPDITAEKVAGDIVGKKLSIPGLQGDDPAEQWTFAISELRQVNIQEMTVTSTGETLVVFVTTGSIPRPHKTNIQIGGKLELQYEWKADKWVLATVRNLTVRYTAVVPA